MTRVCKASIKLTTGKKRESPTASAIAHTTAAACQEITRRTLSILKLCARRAVCANLASRLGKCVLGKLRIALLWLETRSVHVPMPRNTEAIEDYARSVRPVERIE